MTAAPASSRGAATPAAGIGIVPLERFVAPVDRDGSRGSNRAAAGRCSIAAANDCEAIAAWLRPRLPSDGQPGHTWRAYRKEAERFLLWSVLVRGKALSSLDADDCAAYRDFIAAPPAAWIAPCGAQRCSDGWRPFAGPLSARSQAAATSILRSLCGWLVRRHYLAANPWDGVPARVEAQPMPQLRAFSPRQWMLVRTWITGEVARAPSPALHRLRFLLEFGAMTGLRLAELASARLGWLRLEQLHDMRGQAPAWSMRVPGRRNSWREVPLADPVMQVLRCYLVQRGLKADPLANDPGLPLISRLDRQGALSAWRIHEVVRDGFKRCALAVQAQDPHAAERIRSGSTHWLRHTFGAHTVARGVARDVVQSALGHASPATTAIYGRSEAARQHLELQAVFPGDEAAQVAARPEP